MIRKGKLGKVLAMVMGLCNAVPLVDAVSKKGVSNSSYTVGNIVTHSKKNNKPVSKLKQEKQSKNAISKPKLLVSERLKGGMGRFQKGTLGILVYVRAKRIEEVNDLNTKGKDGDKKEEEKKKKEEEKKKKEEEKKKKEEEEDDIKELLYNS